MAVCKHTCGHIIFLLGNLLYAFNQSSELNLWEDKRLHSHTDISKGSTIKQNYFISEQELSTPTRMYDRPNPKSPAKW